MHRMTRSKALEALKSAGIEGDKKALVRIYTENRISITTALAAYGEGVRIRLRTSPERG
jgi:hypothetical protein